MQRKVLAALLAEHDRVVSADRLVESIWPEDAAPEGARRTAMSYVSRLRSSIGGEHVVTRSTGYELVLDGASYDAVDFEAALGRARASDPVEALVAYDEALALWSGRAFGDDADEWWLRPVAARLEELRLVALEERAEHLLDAGRAAEAVADLQGLVAEQPLRERFVELLMRALYLSGRQAEALRAYQSFRAYLADETGLEPSSGLTELEKRITLGDASLDPPSADAVPGYELLEVIGEGAFGAVYRAVQPSVGREVAVKVVRAALADDPRFVQRFEAEAQLVARLEHPHVVPLYDFWRRPGGAFLVFRLLRGGSLHDRIEGGPLTIEEATRLIDELGAALVAAHALGVVHRDVKPANVLFDESGNSYLADFGIALADGATDDAELRSAGSPMYASPEQVRDGVATAGVGPVRPGHRALGGPHRAGAVRGHVDHGDRAVEARRPPAPPGRRCGVGTGGRGAAAGDGHEPGRSLRDRGRPRPGVAPGRGRPACRRAAHDRATRPGEPRPCRVADRGLAPRRRRQPVQGLARVPRGRRHRVPRSRRARGTSHRHGGVRALRRGGGSVRIREELAGPRRSGPGAPPARCPGDLHGARRRPRRRAGDGAARGGQHRGRFHDLDSTANARGAGPVGGGAGPRGGRAGAGGRPVRGALDVGGLPPGTGPLRRAARARRSRTRSVADRHHPPGRSLRPSPPAPRAG